MRITVVLDHNITADIKSRIPAAEHKVAVQAERDMRGYIPSKRIAASAVVDGNQITWSGERTRLFFFGNLYVDPKFRVGGFLTPDGWKSRPGVQKIRSDRKIQFRTGGSFWTTRAKEQNIDKWRKVAKEALLSE